jgi:epoxyqueuosine reductase
MSLKNKLEVFAKQNGIIYGCGSAEPFEEYRETLAESVPFVGFSPEERINPALTLADANSLIAIGLSYNNRYSAPETNEPCARLSAGAVGEDYHITVMRLLEELGKLLFADSEEKYMCFCDTGPLSDALVAIRCGLGCAGLNHAVINERFGAMFFIGYIITTAELEQTEPPVNHCKNCGICVKSCPSSALKADGSFNYERCVAYLTQKKGIIPDELKSAMGTYLYGCDRCRRVCPLTPEGKVTDGCAYPEIKSILSLTNKGFKERYGDTAIGWRGRRTIVRNAIIALGNLKDKRGLELLKPFLEDSNEEIRDAAQWANKQIQEVK